jgi:hypothetical protein
MKQLFITFLLALCACSTLAQTKLMPSGDFWDKRGYFLMRLGFVSGEVIRLDGREEEGQPGFSFGAAMEFRIARGWHLGIGADVHRMHLSDSGQFFIDASLSLKRSFFSQSSKISLRPGVAIGYGSMDYFTILSRGRIERTHFMVWKATFETIFFGHARVAPFIDVGMMGTAFGGNSEHDLRLGPFPYLRAGMMF